MSPVPRACIECRNAAVPGTSRCPEHGGDGRPFAGATEKYRGFPPAVRKAILERDGHRCVMCGSRYRIQADHITPQSRGGSHTVINGRTLCQTCHRRLTGEQFGWGGKFRR
jgi:hypothetical protein